MHCIASTVLPRVLCTFHGIHARSLAGFPFLLSLSLYCRRTWHRANALNTHGNLDDDKIMARVVPQHRSLDLPVAVGDVQDLSGAQLPACQRAKAGSDELCFVAFFHLTRGLEAYGEDAVGMTAVTGGEGGGRRRGGVADFTARGLDGLDDGRVETTVVAGSCHPGAQDGALGQTLSGGRSVGVAACRGRRERRHFAGHLECLFSSVATPPKGV